MLINSITIENKTDLKSIINSPMLITGNKNLQKKEIETNMWALSITPEATEKISIQDFENFIFSLLEKRATQLTAALNFYPAIFYMWFDELSAQLRFNIISDINHKLPFGCTLHIVDSPQPILEKFLASRYHSGISWEELKPLENDSDDDNDGPDEPFILQVFVAHINSETCKK